MAYLFITSACPRCGHNLGCRGKYYDFDRDDSGNLVMKLPKIKMPPFITYSCDFTSKLGCRIQGFFYYCILTVIAYFNNFLCRHWPSVCHFNLGC